MSRATTSAIPLPSWPGQHDVGRAVVLALALSTSGCGPPDAPPAAAVAAGAQGTFEGNWSAAGARHVVPLGGTRQGSIVDLRGTMLLAGADRPGVGFRAEIIGLVDTQTGFVGRGVWTDEQGDQVFSELKGEGSAGENRIQGTFLGGTGRYAGATGSYEFSWQFLIDSDDGTVQGRDVGLKGRFRVGADRGSPGK